MVEWVEEKGWMIDDDESVHGEWTQAFRIMVEAKDAAKLSRSVVQLLELNNLRVWKKKNPDKVLKIDKVKDGRGSYKFGKFDRLGMVNEQGRAYSAMEQADLLQILWLASTITKNPDHRRLAVAAGEVLTDEYNKGGLRLGAGWFSAQTNRVQKDIGMTLNKHLMATLRLFQVGRDMGNDDFVKAAIKAVHATVEGDGWTKKDKVPNIYDYVPRVSGVPHTQSWAFYGMSGNGDQYFLQVNDWKNANYHLYVMRLNWTLWFEMRDLFPLAKWKSTSQLGGISILKWLGDAYRTKERMGFYITHKSAAPGNFAMINKTYTDLLLPGFVNFHV